MFGKTFFSITLSALQTLFLLISRNEAVYFVSSDVSCNNTYIPTTNYNNSFYRKCITQCIMEYCCLGIFEGNSCQLFGRKLFTTLPTNIVMDKFRLLQLGKVMGIGTASQSSDFSPGYIAQNALDGSFSTRAHSGFQTNPWWSVDLGRSYFILVLNFQMGLPSRFSSLTLYLADSIIIPGQYQGVPVFATFPGPTFAASVNLTPYSGSHGMWGRYLTIQKNIADYTDIAEVTFFVAESNDVKIDF